MWVENLRVLKELMRYDEEYIYLNIDIDLHFAKYMKHLLSDTVEFKDEKIFLKEEEITINKFILWIQLILFKEVYVEYHQLDNLFIELRKKKSDLVNKEIKLSYGIPNFENIDELKGGIKESSDKIDEIKVNMELLKGFCDLICEKLSKKEDIIKLVTMIHILSKGEL
tara:strand:- start:159 stop:662 length:504 start_codon:yes stop_codon:yes gene_type:complete